MLEYKLKKEVRLESGMAFRYKSPQELTAMFTALGLESKELPMNKSLQESGLLIARSPLEGGFYCSKYLTRSSEKIVSKKDFFEKIKCDVGGKYQEQDKKPKREKYLFPQIDPVSKKPMHCVYVFKKTLEDGNIEVGISAVIDEEREIFEKTYRFDDEKCFWILK